MKLFVHLCADCCVDVFSGFGADFMKLIVRITGYRCRRCYGKVEP